MRFRPLLTAAFLLTTLSASAQTTATALSSKLVGKALFLRGFWADDKLRFDASGAPQGHTATTSFTVSGVRLKSVQLEGDTLRMDGVRECLLFEDDGTFTRVPLKAKGKKPEEINIEIKGTSGQDFDLALHAIFADSLTELIPSLPSFWQRYATANFTGVQADHENDDPDSPKAPGGASVASRVRERGTAHVGGIVKAPKVTHSETPRFTDYARHMMHAGVVEVYLWVEEDGSISHISVAKPAGLGLDEAAVAAVMKYRFKPATRDDKPVKVDLNIDVNFQIF